jgi:transketolase
VEDGNIIRAIPNMVVLNPLDAVEVKKMIPVVINYKGPVYIRINRNDLPVYTSEDEEFQIGKIFPVTKDADKEDVIIYATGIMVSKAMEAAEKLKSEGIIAQVVNVSTLKPLLKEEVLKYAEGKKAAVTAEEAVRTGGLGQAIASILMANGPLAFEEVAINDDFGTSARNYEELLTRYGLTSEDVYKAVKRALNKSK